LIEESRERFQVSRDGLCANHGRSSDRIFQHGVSRAIRRIGLPTAKDVTALSRRVDALAVKVKARAAKKPARRMAKRAA